MHQVKVVWPELSISYMAATPQRKPKKKKKKQLNLQYLQSKKKRGIYKQIRTHTCIQSTHTITQQSPSVTHSVQSHNQFRYSAVASGHTLTVTHDVRRTA